MQGLRQYILSVCAAAIICAVVQTLVQKKGSAASLTKVLTGLFMMFVIAAPFAGFRMGDLSSWLEDYRLSALDAVQQGEQISANAFSARIKHQAEEYILSKAEAMQVALRAEVTVSADPMPVPVKVRLSGSISPYAKLRLQEIIQEDLGIPKENQIWT